MDGCVAMHSPMPLRCTLALLDRRTPVLSLCDAVEERGWVGLRRRILHLPSDHSKTYGARNVGSRRLYLQCLLSLEGLWGKGNTSVDSAGPQSYFDLLMRSKAPVAAGESSKTFKTRIEALEEEDQPFAIRDIPERAAPATPPALEAPPPPFQDLDGDALMPPPPALLDQPAPVAGGFDGDAALPRSSASSSSSSSDSTSEEHEFTGDASRGAASSNAPPRICGVLPSVETVGELTGWRLRCPNPAHVNCRVYRSLRLATAELGPRACEAYLGAWATRAFEVDEPTHKAMRRRISMAAMRAYLDAHP